MLEMLALEYSPEAMDWLSITALVGLSQTQRMVPVRHLGLRTTKESALLSQSVLERQCDFIFHFGFIVFCSACIFVGI